MRDAVLEDKLPVLADRTQEASQRMCGDEGKRRSGQTEQKWGCVVARPERAVRVAAMGRGGQRTKK